MARKALDTNSKVEAMRQCLCLRDVDEVMSEYGFSKRSAYNWFNRILERLPEILENDKPGPKAEPKQESAPPF
jgi:hypothetical protein